MVFVSVRQGTTDDIDATDIHRLPCHQLSVPITAICVISGQIFMFMFVVSGNCITFTPEFRRHWGGVWKDFTEKGVIEILIYKHIL